MDLTGHWPLPGETIRQVPRILVGPHDLSVQNTLLIEGAPPGPPIPGFCGTNLLGDTVALPGADCVARI